MNVWRRSAAVVEREPTLTWRPLPTQYSFLTSDHPRRLLRAGSQIGKTTAGAVDLIAHVTGENAWRPDLSTPAFINMGGRARLARPGEAGGIEAWVICASWSQSVTIQQKIYELLPKHLLHPDTEFDEVKGFRGRNPAFRVRHKSGGWSLVRIKTMGQGGLRLASATIQYAWFDEPPESTRIYSEITKRVMRAGRWGRVILTMTPVNAPVEWIQEAVEADPPRIEDHHARMEPHEFCPMVPAGNGRWAHGREPLVLAEGTACDEEWIQAQIADTLPHEVPVVCHGEWRMTADAPVFPLFRTTGPESHVTAALPHGRVDILLGIDHGVRTHTQVAILAFLCRGTGPDDPDEVWVMDEYIGQIETTEDDDAEGILAMLERQDIRWAELDEVNGDRAHAGQGRGQTVAGKSNERLAKALQRHRRARLHGIRAELHPRISKAKRGISNRSGSVDEGCTWIHRAMVRGRFHVHPRCTGLIASIQGYDGVPNSPESHAVDGLRYCLRPAIWRYGGRSKRVMQVAV